MVSPAVHRYRSSNILAIPTCTTAKRARTHALLSLTSRIAGAGYGGESLSHGLGCLSNWFEGDLSVPLRGAGATSAVTCAAMLEPALGSH